MIVRRSECTGSDKAGYKDMIALIGQRAHALCQVAAERRRPADAQHLASSAHTVGEEALVAPPMTGNESIVAHSVQEGIVDVPAVLPLGDLVSQIEMVPDPGKIDAHGQRRLSQQVASPIHGVLARVLKVHGKRILGWHDEAADIGGFLIAQSLGRPAGLEEISRQEMSGIRQATTAILQSAIETERPAAERLNRQLHSEEFGIADTLDRRSLAAAQNMVGARHASPENLILKAEPCHWLVVRERHRGHRRRFGAL